MLVMKSVHSHRKKQGLKPGQCYSVAKYKMRHVFNKELNQPRKTLKEMWKIHRHSQTLNRADVYFVIKLSCLRRVKETEP